MASSYTIQISDWRIRADAEDSGVRDRWFELPLEDGWRSATVPGTFQRDLGPDARGVVWYRARLATTGDRHEVERARLRFESAATDCRAWVNGIEVGRHVGDYLPFEFDITDAIGPAGGELVVRVDQMFAPKPAAGVLVQNGHIGKGFHDVVSLQHGGLWGAVTARVTGPAAIRPDGLAVVGDAERGTIRLRVEFTGPTVRQTMPFSVTDPDGRPVVSACVELAPGLEMWEGEFRLDGRVMQLVPPGGREPEILDIGSFADEPFAKTLEARPVQRWSPESPKLYSMVLDVCTPTGSGADVVETHRLRFGFRTVEVGGPGNQHILLNGRPVLLRGMLHWGHEPESIAPAPTPSQVREEFTRLKELGFNAVCLCMVYPPAHYYDLADEMGMLLWQEHPVWKSPMGDEHIPEYQRLFSGYFRRDRNHPSVILVSGACEHEKFNPKLAAWWWETARRELPGTLKQVQTAFFGWSDLDRTDLYDEHTYENSGRWTFYVKDVRAAMDRLPQGPKPFVLGETIIANAWPDIDALESHASARGPWWITGGLSACAAVESELRERYGEPALLRFRRQARRHNLNLRQFQCEVLRLDTGVGGWVMNHLRDVPICRCGYMDDLGRWRYEPHELRGFLGDTALILEAAGHLRVLESSEPLKARLHMSNFGPGEWNEPVVVQAVVGRRSVNLAPVEIHARPGEVVSGPLQLGRYEVDRPTAVEVIAAADGGRIENRWRLWVLPRYTTPGQGISIADQRPFSEEELAPEFEEKGYSSGWGLPVETWSPRPQVPTELLRGADSGPRGPGAVVVGHRLDAETIDLIERGERFLLLASRLKDGLSARTTMLWAGIPFVPEVGPIGPSESEWIVDALHHDLTRRYQRAVPTEELGLARRVQPFIRFLHTHDSGVPRVLDFAFAVRIGAGLLAVSSVDHFEAAGRYWLARLLGWMKSPDARVEASLPADAIRAIIH